MTDSFSFQQLVEQFEKIHQIANESQEVPTDGFLTSYKELSKLFDVLGIAQNGHI
jgi:hypothetical protein